MWKKGDGKKGCIFNWKEKKEKKEDILNFNLQGNKVFIRIIQEISRNIQSFGIRWFFFFLQGKFIRIYFGIIGKLVFVDIEICKWIIGVR